jgi:predicted dienelactone hydrolase
MKLIQLLVFLASLTAACTTQAASLANHAKTVQPIGTGTFPVACSNLAHDVARMNQIGGLPAEFWEGIPDGGTGRYITQILAEPQSTLQFTLNIPDDRGLYEHFAGDTLPMVVFTCYPTSAANNRADYRLPDAQTIPRMERGSDQPIFPDAESRYPLIVYSHGLGGSPVSDDYLGTITHLASHGYVVMGVFHGDARITRIRISDLSGVVYLATNFDRYVELQAMRPLAMKRALDYLLARPGYANRIDTAKIGGFGASLGGEAMLLSMGAHLTQSYSSLSARPVEQDPRIKAAVGYVPYAGMSFLPAFGNDQYGAQFVSKPFLAISGTFDTTAPIKLAEQAVNRLQGTRYLVALDGVEHGYFPEYQSDVFTWALNFFAAHVKDDATALNNLIKMSHVQGGLRDEVRIDYTAPSPARGAEVDVVEFYNVNLKHFFITMEDGDAAYVDSGGAGPGWMRTGLKFKAHRSVDPLEFSARSPVCRFYGTPGIGPNSHFYTVDPGECTWVKTDRGWFYEGIAFYIEPRLADATCPVGTIAVNRAYNNRAAQNDSNHRFSTSNSEIEALTRAGWTVEGVVMCAPL